MGGVPIIQCGLCVSVDWHGILAWCGKNRPGSGRGSRSPLHLLSLTLLAFLMMSFTISHNELLKSLEFAKYVNTVEVLLHQQKVNKVPPDHKSLPYFLYKLS